MHDFRLKTVAMMVAASYLVGACDPTPERNGQQKNEAAAPQAHDSAVHGSIAAGLLPPNIAIGGDSPSGDAVTISFDSHLQPDRLLAWYRSPDRSRDFRIGSELQEGAEHVLSGSTRQPPREFTVRLAPGVNGGTSGLVLITRP